MKHQPKVFFISDLHLGHKNILVFEREKRFGQTIEEHNEWIVSQWNSVVTKHDTVYVLGDVAFGAGSLEYFKRMNGQKFLIRGNHDKGNVDKYTPYFQNIYGLLKYKGFWLSHAPVHPNQLRDRFNIHGHVHSKTLDDMRYINVCVENLAGIPISLETVQMMVEDRKALQGFVEVQDATIIKP